MLPFQNPDCLRSSTGVPCSSSYSNPLLQEACCDSQSTLSSELQGPVASSSKPGLLLPPFSPLPTFSWPHFTDEHPNWRKRKERCCGGEGQRKRIWGKSKLFFFPRTWFCPEGEKRNCKTDFSRTTACIGNIWIRMVLSSNPEPTMHYVTWGCYLTY